MFIPTPRDGSFDIVKAQRMGRAALLLQPGETPTRLERGKGLALWSQLIERTDNAESTAAQDVNMFAARAAA
jgi:hypothetical protein